MYQAWPIDNEYLNVVEGVTSAITFQNSYLIVKYLGIRIRAVRFGKFDLEPEGRSAHRRADAPILASLYLHQGHPP